MIPNGEGWHYLAVKKLAALFRGTIFLHQNLYGTDQKKVKLNLSTTINRWQIIVIY